MPNRPRGGHVPRFVSALLLVALVGCSTRGEGPAFPRLPRLSLPGATAPEDPVYSGSAETVYRTAFEAILAEFQTTPRIVKPERGLLVFSEEGTNTNTSVVVTTVGDEAAAVIVETRGDSGLVSGRGARAIRERVIRALDERLARAEQVAPSAAAPRGTSALAEKESALKRIRGALGFEVTPGYLVDMEAQDLRQLADAIDRRLGTRELAAAERETSVELALTLGKELHDQGRYEEARDTLQYAVDLIPENAVAHCNLGEIFKHLRDFDQCIQHLTEAQRLDPEYPETYINLGIVYDDYVIDDARARENYRKYLELGGTDPRVADWLRALESTP